MTNEAFAFLSTFLSKVFHYFTDWKFPGTNLTPAVWVFTSFLVVFGWRTLLRILNSNDGGGSKE